MKRDGWFIFNVLNILDYLFYEWMWWNKYSGFSVWLRMGYIDFFEVIKSIMSFT